MGLLPAEEPSGLDGVIYDETYVPEVDWRYLAKETLIPKYFIYLSIISIIMLFISYIFFYVIKSDFIF